MANKKTRPEPSQRVRVRIAPSPTGFAHVGTAYAALFNYAFAKSKGGKFVIRLEDTDVKRHVPRAEEAIYEGLSWLGLSWDEGPDKGGKHGPYRQSERLEIYKKRAAELIKKGLAYEDEGAIRFKNPGKDISWNDLIRGKVSFPGGEVTDFVLMKSDGYPTYNYAVVVDDILMRMSHVIRGEEHISNTPRQLALYKALDISPPEFAHLPTLRNIDRKKLSKRRDPVDLRIYQKEGYLPEALVNFLCLLGWSHPKEKEIFDLTEFVRVFNIKRVRKAGPIFNLEKLDWISGEYIRKTQNSKLKDQLWEFTDRQYPKERIGKTIPLVKERIKKLSEYETLAGFFFKDVKPNPGLFGNNSVNHLVFAYNALIEIDNWKIESIDEALLKVVKKHGLKTGDFFMDLRVAITGKKVTPPINESIALLGKKETLKRLRAKPK
jgi:nondiscriminating glutamyl-tRNA synthetase